MLMSIGDILRCKKKKNTQMCSLQEFSLRIIFPLGGKSFDIWDNQQVYPL